MNRREGRRQIMANGQKRNSTDEKPTGPRYPRGQEPAQLGKANARRGRPEGIGQGSAIVEGSARRLIDEFDYAAPAEVFITAGGFSRGAPMTYRRFPTAAAAIRFAIEEVPPTLLVRATMEVSENRFDHQAIQTLYSHNAYPLARGALR
jgi:hypothetical protein